MEMNNELITIIVSVITSILGWFVGRRKRNNDLLQQQLETSKLLMESNQRIMAEYTESQERLLALSEENLSLKSAIKKHLDEIALLRKENETLRQRLIELQERLNNYVKRREQK